jgi:hypothetical protein
MDKLKNLIKNKYFLTGLIGVIILAFYSMYKKNDNEIVEIEGIVEPENIEAPTDDSIYDLNYVIGYVEDYLTNNIGSEITPIPDSNDFSKDHVNGSSLSIAELKQYGLDGITAYNYFWKWNGSIWSIEKVLKPITTTTTKPSTTTKPTTSTVTKPTTSTVTKQFVTVVKYTTKNPPWNSTLSGIAKKYNLTLSKLLAFSENAKYRSNPNLIHVGDKVRVK